MRKQFRSHDRSRRRARSAARRHFRPRVESLEARLALAVGVYNDDFSDDVTPANPGFDQFDTYPARDIDPNNPGDLTYDDPSTINTVLPDEKLIANNLPAGLRGQTGRNGNYFVQNGNPGDPGWGLHAHGHILGIVSSAFSTPQVTFTVPPAGTPGGLGAGEEVSGIGVSVQGFGRVIIIGAVGSVSVELPGNTTWQRIAAFRDDVLPGGARLGAIQALHIFSYEFVAVDNVTVEVSEAVQNTPPEANDDAVIVDRRFGASEIFNPLENDFDAQGDSFAIQASTPPARGSIQEFYDPFGNFRGFTYQASAAALADPTFREDSFTYTIGPANSAHGSAQDTATVRLVLNTPPIAVFDEYEVPHGAFGSLIINAAQGLLDNDFDRDDFDTLEITAHGQPRHGNVTIMPDGSFQYTPTTPDGRILPDAFHYTISDGIYQAHSDAFILVPNEVPMIRDDFVVIEHGLQTIDAFDVTVNDPGDPDGDVVGPPQIETPPQHGTLTVLLDGRLRYVPTRDHVFSDTFTYRLADPYAAAEGASSLATVRILVPNQLPIAQNDVYRQEPGLTLQIPAADGVLSNDTDPDGDALFHATLTKQPAYGDVTLNDDGSFTYDPHGAHQGIDTFGYVVEDGIGQSHAATVSILGTTGLPLARDDSYVIAPNSARRVLNLLGNDWEPDGRTLNIAISRPPTYGRLTGPPPGLNAATYEPPPDFEGLDTFEYRAFTDDDGPLTLSPPVIVYLQVTGSPSVPTTNSDFFSVLHDGWLYEPPYGFLANDPGLPGQLTFATLVEPPRHGTLSDLSLHDNGGFIYTPNPGFVGSDSFQYRVAVGNDLIQYTSEAEIVGITVGNQEPVARDDFYPYSTGSFVWANVLQNDYDLDGDTLKAELLTQPSQGIVVLEPDGDLYFQPEPGRFGMSRFTYRIFDGAGFSQAAEISVGSYHDNQAYLSTSDRKTIRVESTPGTLLEASVSATPPQPTPANVEFPLGYFSFVIRNVPAGGQANVRITLPPGSPPINQYWKYGQDANDPHDLWYEFNRIGDTGAELLPGEIVLHFVDGQRGDSDFQANGVIVDPGGPAFAELAPQVRSVTINDGAPQRSKINSLKVTFDGLVTVDPGAFELRRLGTKKPIETKFTLSQTGGRTVALLTFKGAWIQYGTLKDGNYTLTIRAAKIRDATGDLLDGDGDGIAGGNRVDEFFRRFGDTDGDGDVDNLDKQTFKSAYGKRSRQPGYLWYLDFNGNGRIWADDLARFILTKVRHNRRP